MFYQSINPPSVRVRTPNTLTRQYLAIVAFVGIMAEYVDSKLALTPCVWLHPSLKYLHISMKILYPHSEVNTGLFIPLLSYCSWTLTEELMRFLYK